MSNIIATSIHQLLEKHGSVYIPAIGQFIVQDFSARLNPNSDLIDPPYGKVVFSPTTKDSTRLEKHVAAMGSLKEEKAKDLVLAYSDKVSKRLLKKKEAAIDGLGILKVGKKGSIVLDESTSYYNKSGYGLRALNMPEIDYSLLDKRLDLISQESVPNIPASSYGNTSYWRWFKIFLAALLLFLLLLSVRSCGKFLTNSDASLELGEESIFQEDKSNDDIASGVESDIDNVKADLPRATSNDKSGAISTVTPSNDESDLAVKSADFIPSDGCIIIVGVYKNNRNVVRMQDQLAASGYNVYTEISPEGLTRVGFKFDCEGVDLVNYMRAIRKTIHKNSWYLQPQMEVY